MPAPEFFYYIFFWLKRYGTLINRDGTILPTALPWVWRVVSLQAVG